MLLLIAAAALRLGWGLSRPAADSALAALPDQVEYLALARNVLQGQGLSFVDPRFHDRVYAFRMPGYPLFIAALGGDVRAVRAAQALLDAAGVIAVFLLARRLQAIDDARRRPRLAPFGNRGPLLAAFLVAVNPLLVYFSGLLLSETLFVSLVTWGVLLMVIALSGARPRVGAWVGGAALLSLAVLVRPSAAFLPFVLQSGALFIAVTRERELSRRRGLGGVLSGTVDTKGSDAPRRRRPGVAMRYLAITLGMGLIILFLLWMWELRNEARLHRPVWTDTNSGITLYDGYNPRATGASDQWFVHEMPELAAMSEVERSAYLTGKAVDYATHHPARAVRLAVAKALRTWSPAPLSEQFGNPLYRAVLLCFALPLDLLAVLGLCRRRVHRSIRVFLLLPAIYFTLIHALTIGSLRYRLPAEPELAALAGLALATRKAAAPEKDIHARSGDPSCSR